MSTAILPRPPRSGQASNRTLPTIRAYCRDCCGDSLRAVIWCTCDGLHSIRCPLWPSRFGMRPETVAARYHPGLIDPSAMPPESEPLERLPGTIRGASRWFDQNTGQALPRAEKGPVLPILTPGRAIRANCLQCSETRADVLNCAHVDCPLHGHRMGCRPSTLRKREQSTGPEPQTSPLTPANASTGPFSAQGAADVIVGTC